jgi:hypothetical protein
MYWPDGLWQMQLWPFKGRLTNMGRKLNVSPNESIKQKIFRLKDPIFL